MRGRSNARLDGRRVRASHFAPALLPRRQLCMKASPNTEELRRFQDVTDAHRWIGTRAWRARQPQINTLSALPAPQNEPIPVARIGSPARRPAFTGWARTGEDHERRHLEEARQRPSQEDGWMDATHANGNDIQ